MVPFREDEGSLRGEPGSAAAERALCATLTVSGWVGAACVIVSDAPLLVAPSGEPLLESSRPSALVCMHACMWNGRRARHQKR